MKKNNKVSIISDEIISLNNTKKFIKEALSNKGVNTSGVPFKEYGTMLSMSSGSDLVETKKTPDVWTKEYYDSVYNSYVRPKNWLELPEVREDEEKVVMLAKILDNNSNHFSFRISPYHYFTEDEMIIDSDSFRYLVDWGDGTVKEYSGDAYHKYKYDSIDDKEIDGFKQVIITITPIKGRFVSIHLGGVTTYVEDRDEVNGFDYSTNIPIKNHILDVEMAGRHIKHFLLPGNVTFGFTGENNIDKLHSNMFDYGTIIHIRSLYTSKVTDMSYAFEGSNLLTIPLMDTSNVINFDSMFLKSNIVTIPNLDFSNGESFIGMFERSKLQLLPSLNLPKCKNLSRMFSICTSLRNINIEDIKSVIYAESMLSTCYTLETNIELELPNLINASAMFQSSFNIRSAKVILPMVKDISYMFHNCYSITDLEIYSPICEVFTYALSSCHRLKSLKIDMTNALHVAFALSGLVSIKNADIKWPKNPMNINYFLSNSRLKNIPEINLENAYDSHYVIGDSSVSKCKFTNIKYSLDLSFAYLSRETIIDVFSNLMRAEGFRNINISGNYGTNDLTDDDRNIATSKGWTITG